ncbi:nuclear autoantigenic sperm protein [Pelobates fuscus]|uniref:nuclear autoantigenic sperm protein n=1 Tax=Pelobates fuscus TaxID=191477 RepID=UPI002FE46614
MAEETVSVPTESSKPEAVDAPSTSSDKVAVEDVECEAKKLMGAGHRNLVMKDIKSAVAAFQEASSLLAKKYGDTADECADAFFSYGISLLELARMENGVLGNALEGIPEEEEEEDTKEDPNIPSAENIDDKEREQLREQVYDAMAEEEKPADKPEKEGKENCEKTTNSKANECDGKSEDKMEECDVEGEKQGECSVKPTENDKTDLETKDEPEGDHMEEGEKPAAASSKGPVEKENTEVKNTDSKSESKSEASKTECSDQAVEEKDVLKDEGKDSKDEGKDSKDEGKDSKDEGKDSKDEGKDSKDEGKDSKDEGKDSKDEGKDSKDEGKDSKDEGKDAVAPETSEEKQSVQTEEEKPDEVSEMEETASKDQSGDQEEETEEQMEGEDGEDSVENEETEEKENEEDDVGNLQLAWEMLDLSKIIFRRKETKEAQLKAAQAHLKLGEVSVESENYSQAVEDFLACLKIQQEHLEAHNRLLAETHYQLGLAYQYNCKHEDAISHFNKSIDVISGRITVLSGKIEAATEPDAEIEELKNLLPDIKEKIEDSKEAQKTAIATEIALKETLAGGSSGFSSKENGSTSTSMDKNSSDCTVPVQNCVSDISHLVRKKRKPEEESPLKDSEAKKAKPDLVENGDGSEDAVVPTNEEAEKAEEAGQIPMETAAVESSA